MNDEEIRTEGKYIVIYEKKSGRMPEYGSVSQVKVGDVVNIYGDEGHQAFKVDKITGSKWTKKIRSAPTSYHGFVLTGAQTIDPRTIRRILRLKEGEKHAPTMEEREKADKD